MSKEKKQPTLFEDEQYEWEGMPEFEQKDLSPWHQVNVVWKMTIVTQPIGLGFDPSTNTYTIVL